MKDETVVAPLSDVDYERLRRHAHTHREDLVVRLCAEAGLRPVEIAALEPGTIADVDGTYVVAVGDHATVLPEGLEHDVRKYAVANDVADDDELIGVSARRVQMLVREVADRAAAETGDDGFRDVSSRSLREHFVVSHLRAGVDPRVVAAAAGFDGIAGLAPYLDEPSPVEVAAAFREVTGGHSTGRQSTDRHFTGHHSTGGHPADGDAAGGRAAGGDARNGRGSTVSEPASVRPATALLTSLAGDLGDVETTTSLFETVVERAASVDGYRYAWVARLADEAVAVEAHAGIDVTVADAEVEGLVDDVLDRATDGRPDPVARSFGADRGGVVAVAVGESEGATYVLGLGVEDPPVIDGEAAGGGVAGGDAVSGVAGGDVAGGLHATVGALVGRAFEAVRRRRLLVADLVTELRFDVQDALAGNAADTVAGGTGAVDDAAVVPGLARTLGTAVSVDGVVPGGPGLVLYAEVVDATPETVVDAADGHPAVERVRYLADGDDGPVFELALTDSPAKTLVDLDARVLEYAAEPDGATLVAAVSADADVRGVVETTTDAHPGSTLAAKETVERTVDADVGFEERLGETLTDRQYAVLQAAYHGGYFDWPRESTGEELADSLDVAAPTLHNHLRVAQRKLLDAFFED